MKYRIEKDTLGPVKVPANVLWGPQTERSRHNFSYGPKMPLAIVRGLIQIKKAAAIVNQHLGNLDAARAKVIIKTANHLLHHDDASQFPLHVFQTGSGTQTNMNVNEVISHLAKQIDPQHFVHPNDDVNRSQSSNDTFPTAMMMVGTLAIQELIPALKDLIQTFNHKSKAYMQVVKIGRTHLQDAVPLTVGQEISGWASALQHDLDYLTNNQATLRELPIGGTAVGTGLNAPQGFDRLMVKQISKQLGIQFQVAPNKFQGLANHSGITMVHGALKTLAADLMKVGNDIRFLASGPRAGYDELNIPSNEPGSSIMPGKVNPTQVEALTMVCTQVMGNDVTINVAASQGNFEMNVFKPVIIYNFLQSAHLLTETIKSFNQLLVQGLTVNQKRINALVDNSLMLVTALSPHIGYAKSAKIAQTAQKNGTTLKAAALKAGVSAVDFKKWVDPAKMTRLPK